MLASADTSPYHRMAPAEGRHPPASAPRQWRPDLRLWQRCLISDERQTLVEQVFSPDTLAPYLTLQAASGKGSVERHGLAEPIRGAQRSLGTPSELQPCVTGLRSSGNDAFSHLRFAAARHRSSGSYRTVPFVEAVPTAAEAKTAALPAASATPSHDAAPYYSASAHFIASHVSTFVSGGRVVLASTDVVGLRDDDGGGSRRPSDAPHWGGASSLPTCTSIDMLTVHALVRLMYPSAPPPPLAIEGREGHGGDHVAPPSFVIHLESLAERQQREKRRLFLPRQLDSHGRLTSPTRRRADDVGVDWGDERRNQSQPSSGNRAGALMAVDPSSRSVEPARGDRDIRSSGHAAGHEGRTSADSAAVATLIPIDDAMTPSSSPPPSEGVGGPSPAPAIRINLPAGMVTLRAQRTMSIAPPIPPWMLRELVELEVVVSKWLDALAVCQHGGEIVTKASVFCAWLEAIVLACTPIPLGGPSSASDAASRPRSTLDPTHHHRLEQNLKTHVKRISDVVRQDWCHASRQRKSANVFLQADSGEPSGWDEGHGTRSDSPTEGGRRDDTTSIGTAVIPVDRFVRMLFQISDLFAPSRASAAMAATGCSTSSSSREPVASSPTITSAPLPASLLPASSATTTRTIGGADATSYGVLAPGQLLLPPGFLRPKLHANAAAGPRVSTHTAELPSKRISSAAHPHTRLDRPRSESAIQSHYLTLLRHHADFLKCLLHAAPSFRAPIAQQQRRDNDALSRDHHHKPGAPLDDRQRAYPAVSSVGAAAVDPRAAAAGDAWNRSQHKQVLCVPTTPGSGGVHAAPSPMRLREATTVSGGSDGSLHSSVEKRTLIGGLLGGPHGLPRLSQVTLPSGRFDDASAPVITAAWRGSPTSSHAAAAARTFWKATSDKDGDERVPSHFVSKAPAPSSQRSAVATSLTVAAPSAAASPSAMRQAFDTFLTLTATPPMTGMNSPTAATNDNNVVRGHAATMACYPVVRLIVPAGGSIRRDDHHSGDDGVTKKPRRAKLPVTTPQHGHDGAAATSIVNFCGASTYGDVLRTLFPGRTVAEADAAAHQLTLRLGARTYHGVISTETLRDAIFELCGDAFHPLLIRQRQRAMHPRAVTGGGGASSLLQFSRAPSSTPATWPSTTGHGEGPAAEKKGTFPNSRVDGVRLQASREVGTSPHGTDGGGHVVFDIRVFLA